MTKEPLIILDSDTLKGMFEGSKDGKKLVKKFNDIKYSGKKNIVVTSKAAFLRAIFMADSKVNIHEIQKTLNFLDVGPSQANFMDGDEVRAEIVDTAKRLSEYMDGGSEKGEFKCPYCKFVCNSKTKMVDNSGMPGIEKGLRIEAGLCGECGEVFQMKGDKMMKFNLDDYDEDKREGIQNEIDKVKDAWKKTFGRDR